MRITVVCTDLGVRVPGDKGASMHLQSITRAFATNGHEVQLVAVAGHGPAPEGLADTRLMPHPGRREGLERELGKLLFVERAADAMRPHVREFAPHVVYERLSLFGSAGLRLARAVPGARHITEVNALLAEEEAKWRGLQLRSLAGDIERMTLTGTDHAVAVSAEVAEGVHRVAPATPVTVVENGAEVERFARPADRADARRAFGLPSDAALVAFVGALRPWHGVDVAIDAIATTNALHLVVVGDGPVREDLSALARSRGVAARVHFLGQRTHDEVAMVLAAADAAVAPYPHAEDFSFSPLKLYEYLAAGVPVVASAVGQIPAALAGGAYGTLVPPGDVPALATALERSVSDPAARERAAAGRAHALAHHGWEHRARRIVELSEVTHALA